MFGSGRWINSRNVIKSERCWKVDVAGPLSGWSLSLLAPSLSQRVIGFIFSCRSSLLSDEEEMPKHGMADECRHESGFPWGGHWRCRASWLVCLQSCFKQCGRNQSVLLLSRLNRYWNAELDNLKFALIVFEVYLNDLELLFY